MGRAGLENVYRRENGPPNTPSASPGSANYHLTAIVGLIIADLRRHCRVLRPAAEATRPRRRLPREPPEAAKNLSQVHADVAWPE